MAVPYKSLNLEANLTSRTIEALIKIHEIKVEVDSDESADRFMAYLFQLGLLGKALNSLDEISEEDKRNINVKLPSWFPWASRIQSVGDNYIAEDPLKRENLFEEIDLTIGRGGLLEIVDRAVESKIRMSGTDPKKLAHAVINEEVSFITPQ